jgi:hypothetical protein
MITVKRKGLDVSKEKGRSRYNSNNALMVVLLLKRAADMRIQRQGTLPDILILFFGE